jgi:osmoprotectant transport system substrate-binding protein
MFPSTFPRTIRSRLTSGALAAVLCLAAAGCSSTSSSPAVGSPASSTPGSNPLAGSAASGTVVVGSANFPEDELLGEIYLQALQAKGIKATPKFNLGAREIYYPQIQQGAITIIPEYNGDLLGVEVDPSSRASTTAQIDAVLTARLPSTLEILNPAPAQDKDALAVTQATAAKYHLTSIGSLKPYAPDWIIGGPPELRTRSDGPAGLKKYYGLTFKGFDPLDESGPITLAALTDGKIQVGAVFTTTPQIITDHLVLLTDPKSDFAADNVVPLVYKPAMNATIIDTLNAISAKLTTALLLQMDNEIIIQHADYATVAAWFLKTEGLS